MTVVLRLLLSLSVCRENIERRKIVGGNSIPKAVEKNPISVLIDIITFRLGNTIC